MPSQRRKFGDQGEAIAANYLISKGYKILDRNWAKHNFGEIDIVAAKCKIFGQIKELLFVEVKTIKGEGQERAALAAQNVHLRKQSRLIKTAQSYFLAKKVPDEIPWRVDVIIVIFNEKNGLVKIEHLENALWG